MEPDITLNSNDPVIAKSRMEILDAILATNDGCRSAVCIHISGNSLQITSAQHLGIATKEFVFGIEKWQDGSDDGFFLCIEPVTNRQDDFHRQFYLKLTLQGFVENVSLHENHIHKRDLGLGGSLLESLFHDLEVAGRKWELVSIREQEANNYFARGTKTL